MNAPDRYVKNDFFHALFVCWSMEALETWLSQGNELESESNRQAGLDWTSGYPSIEVVMRLRSDQLLHQVER